MEGGDRSRSSCSSLEMLLGIQEVAGFRRGFRFRREIVGRSKEEERNGKREEKSRNRGRMTGSSSPFSAGK